MTEPHDYERYRHGIGSSNNFKKEIEDALRPATERQTRGDMHDEPSHEAVDKEPTTTGPELRSFLPSLRNWPGIPYHLRCVLSPSVPKKWV